MTVTCRQAEAFTASSNSVRIAASSAFRPTSGESKRRGRISAPASTTTSRYAESGWDLPFAETGSVGSAITRPGPSGTSGSPRRTSPGSAACSSRAATFTASPETKRLPRGRVRRHDLAGVHADAGLEPGPPRPLDLPFRSSSAACMSIAARTALISVVLVDLRNAEHRHDRVADELLHPTAVAFDHRAHLRESNAGRPRGASGVEGLAERGRPGQVAEQDRDGLADGRHGPSLWAGRRLGVGS